MTDFYSDHNCKYTYTNQYGSTSSGSHSNFVNRRRSLLAGVSNPKWKALREQGLEAGSAYERTVNSRVVWSNDVNWLYRWYPWNYNVNPPKRMVAQCRYSGPLPVTHLGRLVPRSPPDIDYSDEAAATIAFLNKVRDIQSPFQILPFIGELKETINMIKHPLKRMRQYTREYRRRVLLDNRRLNKANEVIGAISDHYLAWTYGVKPLIGDIKGALEAAAALLHKTPKDIPVSVTLRRHTGGILEPPVSYYSVTGCYDTFVSGIERKTKCQIKGAIRNTLAHPLHGTLPTLGIRLEEFIPTVWELLPHSFLADYFTNIGDMLGARAVRTSDLSWYWISLKTEHRYHGLSFPSHTGADYGSVQGLPRSACISSMSFKRYKPPLEVRLIDDFEYGLTDNAGHWLNITSLLVSQTSSALRKRIY